MKGRRYHRKTNTNRNIFAIIFAVGLLGIILYSQNLLFTEEVIEKVNFVEADADCVERVYEMIGPVFFIADHFNYAFYGFRDANDPEIKKLSNDYTKEPIGSYTLEKELYNCDEIGEPVGKTCGYVNGKYVYKKKIVSADNIWLGYDEFIIEIRLKDEEIKQLTPTNSDNVKVTFCSFVS